MIDALIDSVGHLLFWLLLCLLNLAPLAIIAGVAWGVWEWARDGIADYRRRGARRPVPPVPPTPQMPPGYIRPPRSPMHTVQRIKTAYSVWGHANSTSPSLGTGDWVPTSALARIEVDGVRNGDAAVVNLPAELTWLQVDAFLDAVARWAGPQCQKLAFCRGRCTVVDRVGMALRDRGYDVSWVDSGDFAQSGWLAVARW